MKVMVIFLSDTFESAVLRTRFPESLVICRCRFTVSVVKVKVKMIE